MAKFVKTRRVRRIKWNNLITLVFTLAFVFWGFTSVFGRAENARLTRAIDIKEAELAAKNDKNIETAREINALGDYANIIDQAEEAGLDFFLENNVVVKAGN